MGCLLNYIIKSRGFCVNKEDDFYEWMDEYLNHNHQISRYYKKHLKSVDNSIKFCTECSSCWESYGNKGRPEWVKYRKNHIPTLNKGRETCPPCKEKEIK